jgi:membrane protein implicated in regulation of membrane protease activity
MDNKKTDIKQTISNVREVFVIVTMFLGLIIFIACSIVALIKLFTGQFLAFLIFALIAAAAFIAAYFVMSRDDKRTAKKKREYRLENITEMKVIDLELGELYFEYDSKIGELSIAHGIPALCGEGELEITSEETGMNTTPLI